MKNTLNTILLSLFISSVAFQARSQTGAEDGSRYGHGEDSIACIRSLSLYREFIKYDNFGDALQYWKIVFSQCPEATKNIYIDGARLWNTFIDKEQNPQRKAEMMDTLRMVYDQRIKYYQQEGSVLGRKGVDILRHPEYRQNADIVEECYGYLNRSLKILGNKSSVAVVATYLTSSIKLFQEGRISDMQVIEDYIMVSDILDYQLTQEADDATLLKVKEANNDNFIASGAPSCASLLNYFQPRYEKNKEKISYLHRVVGFLSALGCESEPFYAKAAEALYKKEPSADAAFGLAKLFINKDQFSNASVYYEKAINLEKDPIKKADYYYQLGYITHFKLNQPQLARAYALEAIKLNPNWGDPYILIGDTYAGSKDCFVDDFEKTTIYWAAVDKFTKAKTVDTSSAQKADERISTYSRYFPDVETIFFYSLKEGDSYTVACWINETTKVRAR